MHHFGSRDGRRRRDPKSDVSRSSSDDNSGPSKNGGRGKKISGENVPNGHTWHHQEIFPLPCSIILVNVRQVSFARIMGFEFLMH